MVRQYTARVDLLVEQMEERMHSGRYAVGDKLPSESNLAADLGVSRPLIREMLARLRERGYIETLNGRGSFVRPSRSTSLLDTLLKKVAVDAEGTFSADHLYAVRTTVEQETARLAARQATDEDLATLRGLVENLAAVEGNAEEYTVGDANFHLAIAKATQNPLFPVMLSPLIDIVVRGIYESVTTFREGMRGGNKGHRAILAAIESRDSDLAAAAMAEHLSYSRGTFPESTLQQSTNTP